MTGTLSCELPSQKYSRMISMSDSLHQLAVAVTGGLSHLNFLSRGAKAPLALLVSTPLPECGSLFWYV